MKRQLCLVLVAVLAVCSTGYAGAPKSAISKMSVIEGVNFNSVQ